MERENDAVRPEMEGGASSESDWRIVHASAREKAEALVAALGLVVGGGK